MKTPKILLSKFEPNPEQDCACSGLHESSFSYSSSTDRLVSPQLLRRQWRVAEDILQVSLDPYHQIYFAPDSEHGAILLNEDARLLLRAFDESVFIGDVPCNMFASSAVTTMDLVEKFITLGLIVPSVTREFIKRNTSTRHLSAWLHLTDRCNLRCSYCYLPHVREDMSSETGHAAVNAVIRSAKANHFEQVKIKYAGGEPLLRHSLILELHSYAQSLAEASNLVLDEVVLSNGTLLTEDIASTLKSLGIRVMISLDGSGPYHDSHRPYAGGRGSFKDVSESIDLALANGLVPDISVTVSSRTAEGLPEIMGWILERELPFSLNFYRENELSATHEDMRLDEQKIINGMLAAFKVIENNLPRRGFLGGIIDRANLSAAHTHTCGVGQNYLVFDQNGRVAKCQMHIRKPITNAQVQDPLAVIRADRIDIQNLSVEEKEGCKSCEWKHWCAGGCPLATYRATGRYDVKSPNCNIYKALYPEALRLEGLRLLKYQDDPAVVQKY